MSSVSFVITLKGIINMDNINALITIATASYIYNGDYNDKTDIIRPFVLKIILDNYSKNETIGLKKIIEKLESDYGLINVPSAVILKILHRIHTKNEGYLIKNGKTNYIFGDIPSDAIKTFNENTMSAKNSMSELIDGLYNYIKKEDEELQKEDLQKELFDYLDKYGVPFYVDQEFVLSPLIEKSHSYLIAKFMLEHIQSRSYMLTHIQDVLKGILLIRAIYSDNKIFDEKELLIDDVSIYVDTPIILNILELKTDEENTLAAPIVNLLKDNGIKIKCFQHNVEEVENIIIKYRDKKYKQGLTIEKFDNANYSVEQINYYLNILEDEIVKKGILIDKNSSYESLSAKFSERKIKFDYKGLEDFLSQHISSYKQKPEMLKTDMDSLFYIYLMRLGKRTKDFRNCKSIFITSNEKLEKYTNQYINDCSQFPLVIDIVDFITAVWVNQTKGDNELITKMLLPYATATINCPSEKFLGMVKVHLNNYKSFKELSDEEYNVYFNDFQFHKVIFKNANGNPEKIKENMEISINEFKYNIQSKATRQLENENQELRLEIERMKNLEKEKNEAKAKMRRESIEECEDKSKNVSNILKYSLWTMYSLILVGVAYYAIKMSIDFIKDSKQTKTVIVIVLGAIIELYGILSLFIDKISLVKKIISKLCNKLYNHILFKKIREMEEELKKYNN